MAACRLADWLSRRWDGVANGKRRHRSSVIAWFAGVTDGAQGPDISTIPSIALRQVEVLRDGASAQYGSDAIAGVINFLLKDDRSGGSLAFNTGTYRAGDGDAYTMAGVGSRNRALTPLYQESLTGPTGATRSGSPRAASSHARAELHREFAAKLKAQIPQVRDARRVPGGQRRALAYLCLLSPAGTPSRLRARRRPPTVDDLLEGLLPGGLDASELPLLTLISWACTTRASACSRMSSRPTCG